ncbi:MAG: MFS transporter [Mangrovicoccus sp.]
MRPNSTIAFLRENAPWLGAGWMLTFSSSFGQTYFIAIFSGEIRETYGLSHGSWGLFYGLGTIASAMSLIWLGALTDRFRVRELGTWVLLGFACACLAMAALPGAWALPFVIFALRLSGQGMMAQMAMSSMARWFVATRGRAISLIGTGFATGEALLPMLFVALMGVLPWRSLWVIAAVYLLCLIPLVRHLLRTERVPGGTADDDSAPGLENRHWTRAQVLRHRGFWLILPAMIGIPSFMTAVMFHQVHYADLKGWTHLQFTSLLPVYTAVSITTMLLSGGLIDRFSATRMITVFQLPVVLAFLSFAWADLPWAVLSYMLAGLGIGCFMTLPAAYLAETYGTRHIGAIKALFSSVLVFGTALGPIITGALIDAGVNFLDQLVWIAGYFVLSSGLAVAAVAANRAGSPMPRPPVA